MTDAEASPDVLGVILMGSRGFDHFVTPRSHHDALVIVARDPSPWQRDHGSPVETWPMTMGQFRAHALTVDAWNRAAFLGVRVPNCFMEVKFRWFCQEWWCVSWDESPWYRVPVGQDFYTHPGCADGGNKWEVRTRIHWIAPTTHTVQARGENEYSLGINFLIPKWLFDFTSSTGFSGGVLITTQTGTDQFAGEAVLGQSSGYLAGPASC